MTSCLLSAFVGSSAGGSKVREGRLAAVSGSASAISHSVYVSYGSKSVGTEICMAGGLLLLFVGSSVDGSEQQQQKAHVPKFGNWEGGGQVLYTEYFDNARKGRNVGRWINPNDPQENPQAFTQPPPPPPPQAAAAAKPPPVRASSDRNVPKSKNGRRPNKGEERDLLESGESRARNVFDELPQRGRVRRMSAGSERSAEQSPLNPQQPVRSARAGPGVTPHTPGRPRMTPGTLPNDQMGEAGSPVPKFGGWDENNPASADNYTELFGNISKERRTGSARIPLTNNQKPSNNNHHYTNSQSQGCSCFGWLKN
ncbi:hypothetical protein J5N97_020629 [Dioscorea zingiberensis]|uniref:RIN4 pathogenic type III effector avirulence factor Avr cleavage site domain-containing protein n=1 Tax=Dioscorea zingiberensis TaxID=325984 RepID=A0A9D5CIE3_9LILI|nr:hypothetical protein J5N97_020629 [Dioscorea zingiberensis]